MAVGAPLTQHRIAGVMFTGSNETAKHIQLALAHREGPIVPFIAETGGLNAMLVDSTALPEQTIKDVIESAFGSAGALFGMPYFITPRRRRCFITMLAGAMAELEVGDPQWLTTDIGPIIDQEAKDRHGLSITLIDHARLIHRMALPE